MTAGEENVNPVWKYLATCFGAVLLAGAGAWMTFGGDKVTEGDLQVAVGQMEKTMRDSNASIEKMLKSEISRSMAESDYSRDKALIRSQLDTLTLNVSNLTQQVQLLAQTQSDAAADRKITNAKLDTLTANVNALATKIDASLRRTEK